jgi:CRISPR-associated protein Csb2
MTTIRLRFPASRYHATPWGRHVNEGVPEWPPSPYRLLRALFDVWQRKCRDLSGAEVEAVLRALAESEPRFNLPAASAAHTRSYLSSNSEDPTDKSLVFDAFLAFQRESCCYVSWPDLHLNAAQKNTLARLLLNLNYLGRSESWVDAALHEGEPDATWRCEPAEIADFAGEITPVACVVPVSSHTGKQKWMEALTVSTNETLRARRSAPPLLKQTYYIRPENCIQTDPIAAPKRPEPQVQAVLLGLDATVLPLATATIEVAEQIRVRLMGAHKRVVRDPDAVSGLFSGKDSNGNKRLDHGHLFILPLANALGRIDRVLLVSRNRNLTRDELNSVRGVRELWQSDNKPAVRCVVAWQGPLDVDMSPRTRDGSPLLSLRRTVTSTTPFVTTRHWRRGRDLEQFLLDEIRRECRNHGLLEPVSISATNPQFGVFHAIEYRRNRKNDTPMPGYAFRIEFAQPVLTPFSLGYGCHFGLGQFRAAE